MNRLGDIFVRVEHLVIMVGGSVAKNLDDGVMVLKSGDYWGCLFRLWELFVIF